MLTIAQVERETGLSKDVLRVWERRYGFPRPGRNAAGDRLYDARQVERLRAIRRLIDQGFRPGRLLSLSEDEFAALAGSGGESLTQPVEASTYSGVLAHLFANDASGLRRALAQWLAKQGLQRFVQDTVPMLNEQVGEAWAAGRLAIHQEHLYSEELARLLRAAIAGLPSSGKPPCVLLTTLPGEEHGLGLLMVEALLVPEGVPCIGLGLQTPIQDIARATDAHGVDVVVLSFSAAFPPREGLAGVRELRATLPPDVEIWAGGAMTREGARHPLAGVAWTPQLSDCLSRLADWRARRAAQASPMSPR